MVVSRRGHALVEVLFVVPMLFVLLTGFVDLNRWLTLKIRLWMLGRQLVRQMALSPPKSASYFEDWAEQRLAQLECPATADVEFVPLLIRPLHDPLRRDVSIDVVQLVLTKPLQAQFPLLRWALLNHSLTMEVRVYEVRSR